MGKEGPRSHANNECSFEPFKNGNSLDIDYKVLLPAVTKVCLMNICYYLFRGPLSEWIMATPLIICCWKLPENWLIAHVLLWSHSPASETEKDEDQRTHRLSSRTSRTSRTGKSVWQGGLFHDEAQAPLHKLANWTMKAHDERWAAPVGKKGWTQKDQKGSSWVGKAQISGGLALEKLRVAAV